MKRLLLALTLATLIAPAQSSAKGLVSLSVCGTDGCHTTRNAQELSNAQDAIPQADPGRSAPYFKLRMTIGEPGQPRSIARVTSRWMPSIGVIRGGDGPLAGWTMPTPETKVVLERLARGLHPFGSARQGETTPSPVSSGSGGSSGGGGSAWAWSLLALFPAALVLAMRRRGRWI